MKKIILIGILLSVVSVFAQKQLSLDEAIRIALANNYSVQITKLQSDINSNNVTSANAGMLPRFDVGGGMQYSFNSQNTILSFGEPIIVTGNITKNLNANATLNWTIFDGFGMFVRYDKLNSLKEKSEVELQIAMESMIRNLVNIYYNAVRQKENIDILEGNLDLTLDRFKRTENKVEFGAVSSVQLLNARVDLNSDSTDLLQAELQQNNDKLMINFILGNKYNENYELITEVSFIELPPLDELIKKAKSLNTSINKAIKDREISEYDKKLVVSSLYPKINLSGGYTYSKQEADQGLFLVNENEGMNGLVNFQWDLFNVSQSKRILENAELMIEIMNISISSIEAQVEMNIRNAYDNYSRRMQILRMEERNLTIAEENYERTKEQFEYGSVTNIELRQAQLNLLRNKQRINNSRYLAKTAETELLLLSGQILQTN